MEMLTQNHRDGVKPGDSPPVAGRGWGERHRPALHPWGGGKWGFFWVRITSVAAPIPRASNTVIGLHCCSIPALPNLPGFGVREPPAAALSLRHCCHPRLLLLEAMQLQLVPLLLAAQRPRRQYLLPPDALVSRAPRQG